MKIAFTPDGWDDFCAWIDTDRKKLRRIIRLIKEASRTHLRALANRNRYDTSYLAGGRAASIRNTAWFTA